MVYGFTLSSVPAGKPIAGRVKLVRGATLVVLDARGTWTDSAAYDTQAKKLAGMFRENFAKFGEQVPAAIAGAGPKG